jgi:lipopolysaccharide export system permease protein
VTRRFNFAFAGEYGRVYKAADLRTDVGEIHALQIERKGFGPDYPTYLLIADSARYEDGYGWRLRHGELNVIPDHGANHTITFEEAWDRRFTERPGDMMARPRSPTEMRYAELTRFITALERSGGNANTLRVERALKIAIPVTCIIIALFGAPLATSTQRGGAAFGVGISLLTTVVFLMLVQLTKAVGGQGIVPPDIAAWIPSALFGIVGLVLMARVRT